MIKSFSFSLILLFTALILKAQTSITDSVAALNLSQAQMFKCFSNGDSGMFNQITGPDYITINADGSYLNKKQAAKMVVNFKGSTNKIVHQETRYYNYVAITTGRAKFYFKSILAADVYFTQTWVWRDNKWVFTGWQGTMTGIPKNYPIFITVLAMLVFFGIVSFIRRRLRKTNK